MFPSVFQPYVGILETKYEDWEINGNEKKSIKQNLGGIKIQVLDVWVVSLIQ